MKVRMPTVCIARVADEAEQLAGLDALTILEPSCIGDAVDAGAAIVISRPEIVVQVNVEIRGATAAIEIEHAAGGRGGRPDLDRSGFRGDNGRMPRGEDVVTRMAASGARRSEVVGEDGGADDGEDDAIGDGRGARRPWSM